MHLKPKFKPTSLGGGMKKTIFVIGLSAILVLSSALELSASGAIQRQLIKLSAKNSSLMEVLDEIRKQSVVDFLYKDEQIENVDKINYEGEGTIEEVLENCLKNTGIGFSIVDNIIVLKPVERRVVQDETKEVKGRVLDETGLPMPGVYVVIQGTSVGTITNANGRYDIRAKDSDAIRFSFVGYKTEIVLVGEKETIDVNLQPENTNIEEVAVVAFGEQKKESVVSAITSVKTDLLKSSSSDLTSTFAGNIAGVVGWQTGGIPGAMTEQEMNSAFYIRGITSFQSGANIDPLILLDGVEVSKLDLSRINPNDIESFNVMKDAAATAMYGARGANGVIYVTTKKGVAGDVYVTGTYERIYSMPTREIDVVGPIEYMQLYNEAYVSRNPGASPWYTAERIERTASSDYPSYVYPAVDWYDMLFKDFSVNNHYNVSARGGGDKVQYYASLSHNRDNGMLKVDQLNQFDPNISSDMSSFLTNLTVDMTKGSKLVLNSITNYDLYQGPYSDVTQAYGMAFMASPVDFAPVYPDDGEHSWPHIRFGGSMSSANPYATIQRGYKTRKRFSTITKAEYIQNLSRVVKGLEFRASVALNYSGYFQTGYTTNPAYYALGSYDHSTGEHSLIALNGQEASRTLALDPSSTGSTTSTSVEYQSRVMHVAAWGDHQTSFTAVAAARELANNLPLDVQTSLPQRNLTFSARGSYGFKDRYFIEMNAGYNGSERFAKENKMGFFPAGGVAWVASKENFLRSASEWLNYLKFRASYGKVGNDGIYQGAASLVSAENIYNYNSDRSRFVYLENLTQEPGMPTDVNKSPGHRLVLKREANPSITWEVAEQANLGVDFKLFNFIESTIDVYQEIRHNIYDTRTTIPASIGLETRPMDNVGKVRARGIDFSGKVQKAFSPDFWMILNGTFTYNVSKYLEIEEAVAKPEWQRKVGHEISQQIGYIAEGLFQDEAEIANSPFQGGDVMPGDIRYRDINGDGVIDVNDAVFMGYPQTPRAIYGLNGFVHYKGFEFSMAFQGSGNRSFWINPKQVSPFDQNRAVLTAIANDHWSVDNQSDNPLWPRLSVDNIINHSPQEDYYNESSNEIRKSSYFMRNGKFLRCRQLEVAYNFNEKKMKKYGLRGMRIYARSNNPFLISSFKLWDVELGENGFNYPIQKTFSVGFDVRF